ncbi:MAG: relaxase/mobilization nuclease domain-containing protein [Pseudomonadota bacterium]
MILKARERGNAPQLADYLLSMRDNEHVELHDIRGFMSDDLHEAFAEAEAIASGTKCKKHLFSMSLNPPENQNVNREAFEHAVEQIERKLDLADHPRALVFHEKEGRRHAHAVWSRIDSETMRAKNMSFYKHKLMEVSRDLYLQHDWEMPNGMIDRSMRSPLNFSRAEWQQAQRAKQDPKLIKAAFQECWRNSDSVDGLKASLEEKGFFLAKGDRRSVVAIDVKGETFALSRWSGVKAKDVRERIADSKALPSVADTKAQIASRMTEKLKSYLNEVDAGCRRSSPAIEHKRLEMQARHTNERQAEMQSILAREQQEAKHRAARLPKGFSGIWSRITGGFSKIKQQNEMEALRSWERDRAEKDRLIARQLDERQRLQKAIQKQRKDRAQEVMQIRKEIAAYVAMKRGDVPSLEAGRSENNAQKAMERARDEMQRQGQRQRERNRDSDREPGF